MVAEIFAGISSFKAMLDMAKALKDMNDATARKGAVIELQEHILSAQAAQFSLSEEVSALKAEIAKSEKWDTEKEKYELKSLGWNAFAYMLKPEARGTAPPHWICTNCYADHRISIIQFTTKRNEGNLYLCQKCGLALRPESTAFAIGTSNCRWID